jgi:hypothetical protein
MSLLDVPERPPGEFYLLARIFGNALRIRPVTPQAGNKSKNQHGEKKADVAKPPKVHYSPRNA